MASLVAHHHATRARHRARATVTVWKAVTSTTVDAATLQPSELVSRMSSHVPAIVTPSASRVPNEATTAERDTATRQVIVRLPADLDVDKGWRCRIDDHPDPAIVGMVGEVVGVNVGHSLHRTIVVQLEGGAN